MHDLLALLWQNDDALRDDAIVRAVVRPDIAIGPIALGMPASELLSAIEHGPKNERGRGLMFGDEHRAEVGSATGTVAHHLFNDDLPNGRLAWLEWAADQRTDRIIVARFVVGQSDFALAGAVGGVAAADALLAALRAALNAALGPGVERRSKHRRARCRPVDWVKGSAALTLGAAYMVGDRWHSHTAVVLEAFDTSWPDAMARWRMFR